MFWPYASIFFPRKSSCRVCETLALGNLELHLGPQLQLNRGKVYKASSLWNKAVNNREKVEILGQFTFPSKFLDKIDRHNDGSYEHSSYDKINLKWIIKIQSMHCLLTPIFLSCGNVPKPPKKVGFHEVFLR